jgi:hypothetical protein
MFVTFWRLAALAFSRGTNAQETGTPAEDGQWKEFPAGGEGKGGGFLVSTIGRTQAEGEGSETQVSNPRWGEVGAGNPR